jgi:hypothetical protein
MQKGDKVKITRDSSKCGVLSMYIGTVGVISKIQAAAGYEIAEVELESFGQTRTLYIQTKYLTKI